MYNKQNLLALRNAIDALLEDGKFPVSLPITSGRISREDKLVAKHAANFAAGTWTKPNKKTKTEKTRIKKSNFS